MGILKYLPGSSLLVYRWSEQGRNDGNVKFQLKSTLHFTYALSVLCAGMYWWDSYKETGEVNPVRQLEVQDEQHQRYTDLRNKIFGENGLADLDKDGNMSEFEKANAYERMGVRFTVKLDDPHSPTPEEKIESLEKAIQSFEEEGK